MTTARTASAQTAKAAEVADAAPTIEPPAPVVEVRTIQAALAAVADSVRQVAKQGHNASQNFNFRGIDAVVNAVGPAFRAHGVVCLPIVEDLRMEPMPLSGGKQATRVVVTVRYRFHGPKGDHLDAVSVGEAFDMGDKATAKAMSVAYRTCLLQALTIPTDEPDPDEHSYEQAPTPEHAGTAAGGAKQWLVKRLGSTEAAAECWAWGSAADWPSYSEPELDALAGRWEARDGQTGVGAPEGTGGAVSANAPGLVAGRGYTAAALEQAVADVSEMPLIDVEELLVGWEGAAPTGDEAKDRAALAALFAARASA